jgi:hypothetical protein
MTYTVWVAGTQVKIHLEDCEEFSLGDGSQAAGFYTSSPPEIFVAMKNKSEEAIKGIILHEMIHAIFSVSGLWQHLGLANEELVCANLESFLSPLVEFKKKSFKKVQTSKKKRRSRGN